MVVSVFSQASKDTLALQYYKKADSLLTVRKHEESIALFKKALLLYQKAQTWEKVASCYNKISENQWRGLALDESIQSSKKAIEICSKYLSKDHIQEANAYDNFGSYYQNNSKYNDALKYFKRSLVIRQKILPKDAQIEVVYNNIGSAYEDLGEHSKALEYFKKYIEFSIKKLGKNHIRVAYGYINIGTIFRGLNQDDIALNYYQKALPICIKEKNEYVLSVLYINMGGSFFANEEYDKSLLYYKKSLDLKLRIYGEDHPTCGRIYNNLGLIFEFKDDHDKALYYYRKALQIFKTAFGENNYGVADIYHNIADIYILKNEFKTALTYHEKALGIVTSIFGENSPKTSDFYIRIAKLYFKQNMNSNALSYYNRGLRVLQNVYGEYHLLTSGFYNGMAITYDKQKEYAKAISYFNKAILANAKNNDTVITQINFDSNRFYDLPLLLETLQGKAKTLQSQFKQDKNQKNLEQSIILYQKADVIVNVIRQSFQNYQDKVTFSRKAKEMYASTIGVHLLKYEYTKDQSSLFKVFYNIEKSKANVLKELLNESYAKTYAGLPSELLETEKMLKTNRASYISRINEEQLNSLIDTVKIAKYENKLFDVNRKQDSLTKILEKQYPKYHKLKYKTDVVSIADIQEKLDDNTTLLEFFTNNSTTYAFTISRNGIAVKELTTSNLFKKVSDLHESIILKDIGGYKQFSYTLYNELIAPIKDKLIGEELIIIPDGSLWHLNFELLLTQSNEKEERNMPYLLRDYAISYANSANLLFGPEQKISKSLEVRNECLAFSFSDSTQLANSKTMSLATLRDAGDDLPGTRKEIKAISNIINGQYYYGTEAIESNFKQNANQYSILHLALHGDVDHKNPQNSKLYFTKSKDTIEDNLLYSHELFALNIPAELAVLSACNTGTGAIAQGEGIMSMGNAFQYAGTKSLLLSSWEVSDKSAPILIENFYTNLAEGMNKAKALQKAKLDFLKTTDFDQLAPFYWGSFYLLGNADPIDINQPLSINMFWGILGGVLILLTLVFIYYRKKSQNL
ncbi:tetratricopeptide repeat protein [Aquimarina mytili]